MKRVFKKDRKIGKGMPSAVVLSILIHAGLFLLAGMLVVFTVVKKEEKKFEPPKAVERPKMKLKKPKVKIKKTSKPKPTTRIVTKMNRASMPDIQLPEMSGMGEGLGGGIGGFDMMPDFGEVTVYGSGQTIGNDLEGITVIKENGQIWIVEERTRDIVQLNAAGNLMERFHMDIEQNGDNIGLEGITFNPDNNHLYVLNEKNPKLLIELDKNGNQIKETALSFASDLSGIFYDELDKNLWILSDESKTVNQCTLSGELIKSYHIPFSKAEGIVVDSQEKEIYIISDDNEKLYVFLY